MQKTIKINDKYQQIIDDIVEKGKIQNESYIFEDYLEKLVEGDLGRCVRNKHDEIKSKLTVDEMLTDIEKEKLK